jgi:hypothetical protein
MVGRTRMNSSRAIRIRRYTTLFIAIIGLSVLFSSLFMQRPVAAYNDSLSNKLADLMTGSANPCSGGNANIGTRTDFFNAFKTINDAEKPNAMGLTGSYWDNSKSFASQVSSKIGQFNTDCDDQRALIQFGMTPAGSNPNELKQMIADINAQVNPLRNAWLGQICAIDAIKDVYVDATQCAAAEAPIITQYVQTCAENTIKSNDPPPTIKTYANLATCAGKEDRTQLATAQKACFDKGWDWIDKKCVEPVGGDEPVEDCALDAIGWIVCPVAKLIGAIVDGMYTLAEELLIFNIEDPYGDNSVYQVWSNIRNLANILFIIAFFVVIFSHATSMGISAYGIRKMLPRIVVAAILVNVSYYICLWGIDLSNIIGAGIDSILKSALAGADAERDPTSWSEVISGVLLVGLGGAAVGGAAVVAGGAAIATAALGAALSFAVVALLAILTTLVILVGRQAFLIILIVLSPLAFVAYILPNTESLFDKWGKMFMTLLIFYPLVSLLFIGSQVAASVMRLSTTSDMIKIFSLGVMAFPLFATPFLLKASGGILGKIGAVINNPNRGPFDRMKKAGQERIDNSKMGLLSNAKKQEKAAMRREKNIAGISKKGNKSLFRRAEVGKKNREAMDRAYDNIYDANREQVAKQTERTRARQTDLGAFTAGSTYEIKDKDGKMVKTDKDTFMEHVYTGGTGKVTALNGKSMDFDGSNDTQRAAIAAQAAKSGDKAMYGKLLSASIKRTKDAKKEYKKGNMSKDAYEKIAADEYTLRDYGVNNAGTVQGGHPDVVKGSYSAFKAVTAEGLASMDGSAIARMGDYLSDEKNVIADMDIPWTRNAEKEAADAGHVSGTAAHKAFVQAKKSEYAQGYIKTAQASLKTAVQQLNTNPIYGGKVPEDGDLGKAIGKAFVGTKGAEYSEGTAGSQGTYKSAAWGDDYKIRDQKPPQAAAAATTPVGPNEELTEGGLIINRGGAASQSQSRPAPAQPTPAPQPAPQPAPTDSPGPTLNEQRRAGGNFGGGFGSTPPATPPPATPGTPGSTPQRTNPDGTQTPPTAGGDFNQDRWDERNYK